MLREGFPITVPTTEDLPETEEVKILRDARELILNNWTQGETSIWDSAAGRYRYCMVGALGQALIGDPSGWDSDGCVPVLSLLAELIREDHLISWAGENCDTVINWNDNMERTHEQVISLFDRAIARSSLG